MPKICGQVNVPTVDETELECSDLVNSTCIIVKQTCGTIGNVTGENLDEVLERLCLLLSNMKQDIEILKGESNIPQETDILH